MNELASKQVNTNCLENIRCPDCGSLEPFQILSSCVATWTDDGVLNPKEFSRHPDGFISCNKCSHSGLVSEFTEGGDEVYV